MTVKNFLYGLSCFLFTLIIGAAIYEHIAVWPYAFAAIPTSLSMFQGEYGLNAAPFWMAIHPITLIVFLLTLLVSWQSARQRHILFALLGYGLILAITFIYFVPELIQLTGTPFSSEINQELTRRGTQWENLSLVRLAFLVLIAAYLYTGAFKSGEKIQ
jgi:hypothetical protein